jgi:Domain of unknown function (DUF5076)
VSDTWFYERTTGGWEIRDENRLLVAVVPDVEHEREEDARRIACSAGVAQPRDSTCVTSQLAPSCAPEMTMPRELAPPPIAVTQPKSVEILRVWADPDGPQQLTLITQWEDPGAWGLLLVDIARHAAQAYAREGVDRARALARIKELFDAEWASPTTGTKDLTDGSQRN